MLDRRRARSRLLSWLLAAALLSLLLTLIPLTAQPTAAQADLESAEAAAAAWLVDAYQDGEVTTGGALADLLFALAGAQTASDTITAARADLEGLAADYIRNTDGEIDEGPTAKALLAIQAAGGDGTDVDGIDLEAELRALLQTDGNDAGRFDDANNFTQSLAIMALETTEAGAPAEATQWLADRRCPDGGWTFALADTVGDGTGVSIPCMTPGEGEIDTTALAIQALLDADAHDEDRDRAVAWLLDQQGEDGAFDDNANSTGLAAQALRSVGAADAADVAAQFVITLQYGPQAQEVGAIRFTADSDGSLLLATSQGILAFGAPALQHLAPPPSAAGGACDPLDSGVTVVVDLTFFQAGQVLTGCAPGDPASGLDALRMADFDIVTQQSELGEFVCAIDGLPELACDQPFEGQFWAYFDGQVDGAWADYAIGADASDPAPGDVEGWAYSDGAAPPVPVPGAVGRRLAGTTRVDTAVRTSQDAFAAGSADGVVLARADDFPDALAGTPLAAAVNGPLLTTGPDTLPGDVAAEIDRVLAEDGTVYVLGGPAAVSQAVVDQLEATGHTVQRVFGQGRITTAIAVAEQLEALGTTLSTLLVTTGGDFADALAAGTAAAAVGDAAVLLTGEDPSAEVDQFLTNHPDADVVAVGGPAAEAYPEAEDVVGATREATAIAVAERFFNAPPTIGLARRDDFADALAGGAHIAALGGPLVISPTQGLAQAVTAYVCATDSIDSAVVYGGEVALAAETGLALAQAVTGEACT